MNDAAVVVGGFVVVVVVVVVVFGSNWAEVNLKLIMSFL